MATEKVAADHHPDQYILESRADYDARLERHFAACREMGRLAAERFEARVIEILLGRPPRGSR